MYKKYLGTGIALATVGGVLTLTGVILMATLISSMETTNFIIGCAAGIPLFLGGGALLAVSSYPFMIADATKRIYTKFTGQRSFTPRISSTGGFCGEERKLEIALGYQF